MRLAAVVGVVALLSPLAGAQESPPPLDEASRQAVTILRVVNTAEWRIGGGAKGGFGTLAQVLASPTFQEQFKDAAIVDSATATVGARTLTLLVSEDRKHFHAMVAPSDKCGLVMFTNESALIYSGRGLGCGRQD